MFTALPPTRNDALLRERRARPNAIRTMCEARAGRWRIHCRSSGWAGRSCEVDESRAGWPLGRAHFMSAVNLLRNDASDRQQMPSSLALLRV